MIGDTSSFKVKIAEYEVKADNKCYIILSEMNGSINYVMKEVLSCNSSSPRFPSLDSFTASSGKNTTHY